MIFVLDRNQLKIHKANTSAAGCITVYLLRTIVAHPKFYIINGRKRLFRGPSLRGFRPDFLPGEVMFFQILLYRDGLCPNDGNFIITVWVVCRAVVEIISKGHPLPHGINDGLHDFVVLIHIPDTQDNTYAYQYCQADSCNPFFHGSFLPFIRAQSAAFHKINFVGELLEGGQVMAGNEH